METFEPYLLEVFKCKGEERRKGERNGDRMYKKWERKTEERRVLTEGVKRMEERSKSLRNVVIKEQIFSKRPNLHMY
jgi:hypothetical protein